jgi:hypothetical protein
MPCCQGFPCIKYCTAGILENVLLKILAGMPAAHFEKGNARLVLPTSQIFMLL